MARATSIKVDPAVVAHSGGVVDTNTQSLSRYIPTGHNGIPPSIVYDMPALAESKASTASPARGLALDRASGSRASGGFAQEGSLLNGPSMQHQTTGGPSVAGFSTSSIHFPHLSNLRPSLGGLGRPRGPGDSVGSIDLGTLGNFGDSGDLGDSGNTQITTESPSIPFVGGGGGLPAPLPSALSMGLISVGGLTLLSIRRGRAPRAR